MLRNLKILRVLRNIFIAAMTDELADLDKFLDSLSLPTQIGGMAVTSSNSDTNTEHVTVAHSLNLISPNKHTTSITR